MNHLTSLVMVAAAAAIAGCHGNGSRADASRDGVSGPPPPPVLGAQIDRMGRPAISASLVGVFAAAGAAKTAQQDAYNQAPDPAAWKTTPLPPNLTIERELEVNLAVFDVLDKGLTTIPQAGCGNATLPWYAGPPSAMSYQGAADLLADDQLYVDTARAACPIYFALEIEQLSSGSSIHTTCGGRTPRHDVVDVTYSLLAAGLAGLDQANNFSPKLHDGAAAHADVTDTFPFLGPPH